MAGNITVKYSARLCQWLGYSVGTHTSTAQIETGDLLLLIYMSGNQTPIQLYNGWKWIDPPSAKSTSNSISLAYKQITSVDRNATLSVSPSLYGGATYVHLSPCNIVAEGIVKQNGTMYQNYKGENYVIQTNNGDGQDARLRSSGFNYLVSASSHYSNGYTALIKNFTDSTSYFMDFVTSGWNSRPSYLILSVGPVKETKLEVSYSIDGVLYSSYAPYDASKPPQARFLKFKAKLSGGQSEGEVSTFEFDQSKPETKVALGKFLESVSTNLVPKKTYTKDMEQDTSYSEEDARLFKSSWTKSEFKKMLAMQIK